MLCEAMVLKLVVRVAAPVVPVPVSVAVPIVAVPSLKVTVPVGV